MTLIIFVYGTLRKGFVNHDLLDTSEYLGMALTKNKYALYADRIPYACAGKEISRIVGEVYEVSDQTLRDLDKLEGHPDNYRRELTEITLRDGRQMTAWMYFFPYPVGNLVPSGDYIEYAKKSGIRRQPGSLPLHVSRR